MMDSKENKILQANVFTTEELLIGIKRDGWINKPFFEIYTRYLKEITPFMLPLSLILGLVETTVLKIRIRNAKRNHPEYFL